MPSTDAETEGSAEDQAYFHALEEAFLRLRGRATLLSAADWQVAREWRRAGIPIELVVDTMTALFERHREKRPRRGISSLSYFRAAVASAWDDALSLRAGGGVVARDSALSVPERLQRLEAALPEAFPGRDETVAELRALEGVGEVEPRLAEIDRRGLDRLAAALSPDALDAISTEVERLLAAHGGRLEETETAGARARLRDQALRRRWGIPVLSLFSPEAQEPLDD